MKRFQFFQYSAAAIASLGLVLPSGVSAADASQTPVTASAAATPTIMDVSLGDGGTLGGQVLDAQGAPLAQAIVTVRIAGTDVASAVTDRQGYFSIHGLQGGVYEVKSSGSSGAFRLWAANTSPPSANKGVLIVAGGELSRGQCGQCGSCNGRCTCPAGTRPMGGPTNGQVVMATLVIAGLTGGIVAVAVSTHEHQSGS